jgi:hypothetical protein
MDKKIQAIRNKNEQVKTMFSKYEIPNVEWENSTFQDIEYLLQQIEIKDKELGFYADRENWRVGPFRVTEVELDNGRRARAALKGEDTNE